jgi:hypothetical protein
VSGNTTKNLDCKWVLLRTTQTSAVEPPNTHFLLYTGYHKLDEDLSTTIVRSNRTQKTFRNIKRNLHLNNSDHLDANEKLYKVRPYVEVLNKKFQQFGILHHHLSIDEQMIPYRGRHSCKMFIFGKPVKFGYKSWTITSSNGYVYGFEIYSGKGSAAADNNLGIGGYVVINLTIYQITQFTLTIYSHLFRCSFIYEKEEFCHWNYQGRPTQ